ncbi:MAG: DUF2851 family protein [Verrucomicrobiae bacterium]|nr:DUF2851 family protein [Verrucomicrobiae bacterium]
MTYPYGAGRYEAFLAACFGVEGAGRLREPVTSARTESGGTPELELQARWFAGEFGREFVGRDGERIEIVQFGHWNRSAGPDFTEAVVRIDGELRRGAVEVDQSATDWEAHGHGINPEFDDVVLHVHFGGRNPTSPRFFTRDSRHRAISQLPLELAGWEEPAQHWGHLPIAKLGRCATPLRDMGEADLEALMMSAAQYRLMRKARRFSAMAAAHSEGQALFQLTAEALGYRHNKLAMAVLAQRLPRATLGRHEPEACEALLFGVAGFLTARHYESAADAEARRYLKSLWDHWWRFRDDHEPDPLNRPVRWKLSGARPVNHPQRRVAALASVANGWDCFQALVRTQSVGKSTAWAKALSAFLSAQEHSYWNRHYTLQAKPSDRRLALIGKDRVQDLLGNVLFPAAIGKQPGLWIGYLALPGSVSNESLRRATQRLFGLHQARSKTLTKRYWQQQALLQIYRDFCLEDASDCRDCPFPEQLAQWKVG